ncbi:hypothetical protein PFICI_09969 [Pestalotiopsis fici W106-1]|uniref:Uncharacterized protein n=1 Tax=Pestalotiopsis fici (strain W106-1 / CGMCC3.15140) TaxID=1229662 RepID=W3WXP8_PESFW|nr:uncharacterized protein PFICI_09969 [Pestalotiopsis fici W106-1]ETS77907.1 hypothetical protein PFICI_09969 [Pestalotiopsis fici W106-1]
METNFDITPEKRASFLSFFKRQLFRQTAVLTRDEVNLAGQTVIVTGSNTGIGFECSCQLMDLGVSRLILAVRSTSKGEAARNILLSKRVADEQIVEVWQLDLSSYDSITKFAQRLKPLKCLDIFVHNAGLNKRSFQLNNETGHEECMQTNYLSLALLTILVLPIMQEKRSLKGPGRILLVSSETAAWAPFKERESAPLLAAFDKADNFDGTQRYWNSKLLGQLFLSELAKRIPSSVAVVNAPNPGLCYGSSLTSEWNGSVLGYIYNAAVRAIGRSTSVGAQALTDAAVRHGTESHGHYIEDGKLQPMAPLVYTEEGSRIAKRLWNETMESLAFAQVAEIVQHLSH